MRHPDGHEMTSIYEHTLDSIPEQALRSPGSSFCGIRTRRGGGFLRLGVAASILGGALLARFVTSTL